MDGTESGMGQTQPANAPPAMGTQQAPAHQDNVGQAREGLFRVAFMLMPIAGFAVAFALVMRFIETQQGSGMQLYDKIWWWGVWLAGVCFLILAGRGHNTPLIQRGLFVFMGVVVLVMMGLW